MSDATGTPGDSTPKKGGFGAFAQKYRDRWVADHPKSTRRDADATSPPAPTAPDAPTAEAPPSGSPTKA